MKDRLVKRNYVEVDAEVEVYFSDIIDCVSDLDENELKELYNTVCEELDLEPKTPKTLNDVMKEEWWEQASKKYTLEQLEEKLGNKFDLM